MREVVVVGGGPAGTKTASMLAKDHDILLIEEHPSFGSPAQCTGLVTERVIKSTGVGPTVLNRLMGARFHFPDGRVVEVSTDEVKAVLIDRTELDTLMAEKAQDSGAELLTSTRYRSHIMKDGTFRIATDRGEFGSRVLVGADGHSSRVAMSLGDNGPKEYVRGIQYDVRRRSDTMDLIDLYFGNSVAPGFFAWSIPFDDFTRVGLCTSWDRGLPSDHMKSLLRMTSLDSCEVVRKYSGKIPLGGRTRTYSDGLVLVGDAAGQVKAISGGGLFPGLIAAECAADTVHEALVKDDTSSRMMSSYEKGWKAAVGKNLRNSYRIRRLYTRMDDEDFGRMYPVLSGKGMMDIMRAADVDDPGKAVRRILRHPAAMVRMIPPIIRTVL